MRTLEFFNLFPVSVFASSPSREILAKTPSRCKRLLISTVFLATFLATFLSTTLARAGGIDFQLEVSPREGTTDDEFVATVRIAVDGVRGPDQYWPPEMDDFELTDSPQKQRFSSTVLDPVRGMRIQNIEATHYRFRAKAPGRFQVGPAKIKIGGKEYETKKFWIKVGKGIGTGASDTATAGDLATVPGFVPPDKKGGAEAFLHVVADKSSAFVGEQVTVTWILFSRAGLVQLVPESPSLKDMWSETLFEPDARPRYGQTRVGGIPYLTTIISQRALFPQKAGLQTVNGFRATVGTERTPFRRPLTVVSPRLPIEVRPLPDGAPDGFDPSYVGNFAVETASDRPEIQADDSLTLTLKVVAKRGAIRNTKAPKLSFPGFSFREPRDFDEKVAVDGIMVGGERVYRYWTTPKQGGQQVLPPVVIDYFDPETQTYEKAASGSIPVMVVGEPGEKDGDGTRENIIRRDIRPIIAGRIKGNRFAFALYRNLWFWIALAFPLVVYFLVIFGDRLRRRLKKETPRSRLRRARGRAKKAFKSAERLKEQGDAARFFAEISRVLQRHIEECLETPTQSLTREQLKSVLADRGVSPETIASVDTSLEEFDFCRFSKSAASREDMDSALKRTRDICRRIEQSPLKAKHDALPAAAAGEVK